MSWLFGGSSNPPPPNNGDDDDDEYDDRYDDRYDDNDYDDDDDDVSNTKVISDFDASALVEGAKVEFVEFSRNFLIETIATNITDK